MRRFSTLLLLLCLVVSAHAQVPRVWLRFDGNTSDSSGAGVVTAVTPSAGWTPAYTTDRTGTANRAITFTSGRSLQLVSALAGNSAQSLGLRNAGGTAQPFTIAAWVNVNATSGPNTIAGLLGSGAGAIHAGVNGTRAELAFENGNNATGATAVLAASTWFHVAVTFDGTNQRLYVNGIPELMRASSANTVLTSDLYVGNWGTATSTTNDFIGALDDVAVWNSALPAGLIVALADGVSPGTLPATWSGPKLPGYYVSTAGAWSVREIKGFPTIGYGTLVNADRIIRAYAAAPAGTVAEYQVPVINMIDDEGAGNAGYFPNEGDFGTNTAAADDNVLMIAKCAVRIPVESDYTFGFRGDDGSRLRVLGKQFLSSTRLQTANVANPAHGGDNLFFPNSNGDSNTIGVVHLEPGDYNLEFVWWEGTGGCSVEVFAAPGAKTAFDSTFQLIGNTAAGGLEIVRDPDTYPRVLTFTANGGNSVFVHGGVPANVTLAWTTNTAALPAQTVSINQGIGAVADDGSQIIASPATTTTYTLTSTLGADTAQRSVTVYVNQPPAITSFTANDTTVTSGAAVTLNWAVEGATSLTLNPGSINVTGQTSRVVNPASTTTYTLVATNPAGSTQQQVTVTVGPAPTINSFTVTDANPLFGAETTLNWNVSNFDTLAINQGVGAVSGTTGSVSIFPLATTTYTLTATNVFGSATANAVVNQPNPIGVTAAGFNARRVSSTVAFPFAGTGYLGSAIAVLGGTNAGATTTQGGYTTVNFSDGADGDFTSGNNTFPGGTSDNFAVEITATLVVNTPGEYTFAVNCDDGCRLRVDGQDIIVDDGTHAPGGNSGRITLTKPTTTLQLIYYDAVGGAEVELAWIRPNLQWSLLTTITPATPIVRGGLLISEFMADNATSFVDEDGESSDWIEIWNSTGATINLAGHFLTDTTGSPNKWPLPAWTLGANQYAVIFASGKNRTPAQAVAGQDNPGTLAQPRLHTNFSLSKNGGYLALKKDNGMGGYDTLTEFNPYPAQRENVSYGSSDAEGYVGYMETQTPGQANGATVVDFVADTQFSHPRGRYAAAFNLAITTTTPGATIRYTTNGSPPTVNSGTVYTGPIPISATTVVRAAAYKAGWKPTNIDTQTYLFIDDIVNQGAAHATALGFPAGSVNGQVFRYGMTLGNVTAGGGTLAALKSALAAAPSVCLTTDVQNLVNTSTGIYVNPSRRGLFWERPASLEYLNAAGVSEFQIDCGTRIRGGFSRSTSNPKHAFHLYFRGLYDGDLKYRVFGTSGAAQFDQLDMRCEQNYSWGFQNDTRNALMREEFARTTQGALGQPFARTGYFHLYLNGVYWGIFNWEERTEAAFGETYLGGTKDTTDVVKSAGNTNSYSTEMTDGNIAAWQSLYSQCIALKNDAVSEASRTARYMQMRGLNPDGTPNAAFPVLLDVDNLIDYQLIIFHVGSWDAPVIGSGSNNWFGVRDRGGLRGFAFFAHDTEHGMDAANTGYNRVGPWGASGNNNWGQAMYNQRETLSNGFYNKSNPHYVHEFLCYSAEYRQRFADRVQKHFFNTGAMTTAACVARVNALAAQVDPIIHAEAARWGSASLNRNSWVTARNDVLDHINLGLDDGLPGGVTTWTNPFPGGRTPLVVEQLRGYQDPVGSAKALFPASTLSAPTFSGNFGGPVANPHNFTITNPNGAGTLYYTTNGTDPRAIGGAVAAGALTGGSPIAVQLTATSTVKARVFNGTTWSALTEAEYLVGALAGASNLVVSKIHYHPASAGELEEFVEVQNISAQTIDLTNCAFTLGLQFTFPDGFTLAPGARALIVRDLAAFNTAFPGVPPAQIAGVFANGTTLDNGGERLIFVDASGSTIRDFTYDDTTPWPEPPDGDGPCLVLKSPAANPNHALPENWRASYTLSPGANEAQSYALWATQQGIADPTGTLDLDGDGLLDVLEYGLAMPPLVPSQNGVPTTAVAAIDVGGTTSNYLTLTYTRPVNRDDLAYAVEASTALGAWSAAAQVGLPVHHVGNGTETLTFRHPQVFTATPEQFLRLRVTRQP